MKRVSLCVGTENGGYLKLGGSIPALLYGEIVSMLEEYHKFEMGKEGTRFDAWLDGRGNGKNHR